MSSHLEHCRRQNSPGCPSHPPLRAEPWPGDAVASVWVHQGAGGSVAPEMSRRRQTAPRLPAYCLTCLGAVGHFCFCLPSVLWQPLLALDHASCCHAPALSLCNALSCPSPTSDPMTCGLPPAPPCTELSWISDAGGMVLHKEGLLGQRTGGQHVRSRRQVVR